MLMYFSTTYASDSSTGFAKHCSQDTAGGITYAMGASGMSMTFFKGTIPTSTQMNGFLLSSRSSDALLRFNSASNPISVSGARITFNFGQTNFGSTLLAGTMTWFAATHLSTSDDASHADRPMLFGTVGIDGSGADLIMPKVDVVLNELWLCTSIYMDASTQLTLTT